MKLWACKKMGNMYNTAKSADFLTVPNLEKDNVALNVNKEMSAVMSAVGLPSKKAELVNASAWLSQKQIDLAMPSLKYLSENGNELPETQRRCIVGLMEFFNICNKKGYSARLY